MSTTIIKPLGRIHHAHPDVVSTTFSEDIFALDLGPLADGNKNVPAVLLDPEQFFRAYLVSFCFYLGLPLGSLAILMLYHLTGGAWGFLIRRLLEAGLRTLPLFAVLFAPIACGLEYLYVWARPEIVGQSKSLQWQQIYLNAPFFWVRAAIYFVAWIMLASTVPSTTPS